MFGRLTLLQKIIKEEIKSLSSHMPQTYGIHTDDAMLNPLFENNFKNILQQYPHFLFEKIENKGPLYFASLRQHFGSGFERHYRHVESTAVTNHLLEHGAGIGADFDDMKFCEFGNINLLIGLTDQFNLLKSSDYSYNSKKLSTQIRKHSDIVEIYNQGALTDNDLCRLTDQANLALQHGKFDNNINRALIKAKQTIEYCKFKKPGKVKMQLVDNYIARHGEISILLLQTQHQLYELPIEILHEIVSALTGLKQPKIEKLRQELLYDHALEYPQILNRLA